MELRHLLLAYVLLTFAFTTSMWFIAGTWMGLSRKAASDWMRANLTGGLALVLLLFDTGLPRQACLMLSCCLMLISAMSTRRGLQSFFRQPQALVKQVMVVLIPSVLNLLVWLPSGLLTTGIVSSSLVAAVIMIKAASDTHTVLAREFRPGTALAADIVLGVTAFFCVGIAIGALGMRFLPAWMPSPATTQTWLAITASGLTIAVSFVLGYIVVMRLVYRLQHLSQHDSLTGLLNRRAIENSLDKEAQRLQRFGEVYSVMLVDIDHFKRINDNLGHAAGDEVLRAVAAILKDHAREVDRVARYGGEEFCVLLPHTDHEGALQAAERLRSAVHRTDIPWQDEQICVTISTGLATAQDPDEPLHALLKRADDALYRAKTEGRNRVVAAPTCKAA
ncbi:MAG: GGDEF domain-containing protein [Gammaproteobacteria bacterium]|nr:GGDEF domain-containing protein [Gammaproteobacteria bacterium]